MAAMLTASFTEWQGPGGLGNTRTPSSRLIDQEALSEARLTGPTLAGDKFAHFTSTTTSTRAARTRASGQHRRRQGFSLVKGQCPGAQDATKETKRFRRDLASPISPPAMGAKPFTRSNPSAEAGARPATPRSPPNSPLNRGRFTHGPSPHTPSFLFFGATPRVQLGGRRSHARPAVEARNSHPSPPEK